MPDIVGIATDHAALIIVPRNEKICIRRFRPGPTQAGLYSNTSLSFHKKLGLRSAHFSALFGYQNKGHIEAIDEWKAAIKYRMCHYNAIRFLVLHQKKCYS